MTPGEPSVEPGGSRSHGLDSPKETGEPRQRGHEPEADGGDQADLRRLKGAVRRLPEGDPVRRLIEAEPDSLPLQVLAAKADSWVLLLFRPGD